MSIQSMLSAKQKDSKKIGPLKTDNRPLCETLKPLQCALLSVPLHKGFTLPAMVEILQQWSLFKHTKLKEHFHNCKLLKDVLHNPRRLDLGQQ